MFKRIAPSFAVGVCVVLCCGTPSASVAQSSKTYIGYAGTSCGTWVTERKKPAIHTVGMQSWAMGVVSGANMTSSSVGKDRLQNLDVPSKIHWLGYRSESNPESRLSSHRLRYTTYSDTEQWVRRVFRRAVTRVRGRNV